MQCAVSWEYQSFFYNTKLKMRRINQILLIAIVLLSSVGVCNAFVKFTGGCGKDLVTSDMRYEFYDDGTLVITGSGEMMDYSSSLTKAPWYSYEVKKVVISEGVENIGNYAFDQQSKLTEVSISNSVSKIGERAFRSCSELKQIDIPNSVKVIEFQAFCAAGLTSIKIPNSITEILEYTFTRCHNLTDVTLPNSIVSIYESAFSDCLSLVDITIPESVTYIGSAAFSGCGVDLRVTCTPSTPPTLGSDCFDNTATINVGRPFLEAYKSNPLWKGYNIVGNWNSCQKPTISFDGKVITCQSETEGAQCHYIYRILTGGDGVNSGSLENPKKMVAVSAYASAEGKFDSEIETVTFDMEGAPVNNYDVDGDGQITMSDANIIVNMYLGK